MSLGDDIASAAEALLDTARRIIGDTAGPAEAPAVPDGPVPPPHPAWTDGWWEHARRAPAHPGRVGGAITPYAIVVHTTDMAPETFPALLKRWQTEPADGSCAHFVIGRDAGAGVVQLVPTTRNANHAGGNGHGVFVDGLGNERHPNLVSVGIELHCAGGVRLIAGQWRLVEAGMPVGAPIDASEVIADPAHPGRGWHRVTEYQYQQLVALLADLEAGGLAAPPAGIAARSLGEIVPTWGVIPGRVVGHVSLDPAHRSDPWPATMQWLRERAG